MYLPCIIFISIILKRRKLHDKYGGDVVDIRGPMPAHLLSDMWGRWADLPSQMYTFSPKGSGTTSTSLLSHSLGSLQSTQLRPWRSRTTPSERCSRCSVKKFMKMETTRPFKFTKMENTRLVFCRRGTISMQRWACSGCRTLSGNARCWRNQRIGRWLSSLFAFFTICFALRVILLSSLFHITTLSTRNHHSKSVEFGSNFKLSQICQIWGDRTMIWN